MLSTVLVYAFLTVCFIWICVVAGPALPPGYKRGEPSGSSDENDSEQEVSVKRAKTGHNSQE